MPSFRVTVSEGVARWLEERASVQGASAEALIGQLVEEASRRDALSREEESALRCFGALQAEPRAWVPVRDLRHQWARLTPGTGDGAFNAAFNGLAEKGLVLASDASGSAFTLTPAGREAARIA